MAIEENSYEEYKKNLWADRKKKTDLHNGKVQLIVGIALIVFAIYHIPFHAAETTEVTGNELKSGKTYYINDLQILSVKEEEVNKKTVCIAKFYDRNQEEWLLGFTVASNTSLAERIEMSQKFSFGTDYVTGCYVTMEKLSGNVSSYFSVYGAKYAKTDKSNMLALNADYLCGRTENFILQAILKPGYAKIGLIVGTLGMIRGIYWLLKNRPRKNKNENTK